MTYTLLHNPRCSKSRAALELLQTRGVDVEVVRYLDTPLDADALRTILRRLDIAPRALLRTGEAVYRELGLNNEALDDGAIVDAMVRHPELIERPILVRGERAVIGRPTERLLHLLD
ncbi:arsenate reductase (glutaredoxin) [Luteimonas sp. 3794]|uniref:arsenate reductase (glutaredoxin) n=1 Tax=Luteimonas sp. 3794 TaxID=2817730 RepID=UPI002862A99D|nr:arsenate reductase (glutaredoxin) [Luteimonas sp. 3794]MDR6992495.1 arsenate reductase [Luteimonas sp. 3794]